MKILLVSPCLKSEIRPNQFSIPQLTLSLIAAMTPQEHEVLVCEEVYGDIIDYDGDYDLIGFESVTDAGINSYRKTLKTVEENVLAIKKLRNNGILSMVSVVFGLDTDTEAVFDITHDFLLKSKPAFLQACVMTPYPGTPVFEHLKSEGRILTDDWSKYDTKKIVVSPKNISAEKLQNGYNKIRKSTYGMSSILSRVLPHFLMGKLEILLYFSLNIGARITYNKSDKTNIYKNHGDLPIDFDTAKYIKPFKK